MSDKVDIFVNASDKHPPVIDESLNTKIGELPIEDAKRVFFEELLNTCHGDKDDKCRCCFGELVYNPKLPNWGNEAWAIINPFFGVRHLAPELANQCGATNEQQCVEKFTKGECTASSVINSIGKTFLPHLYNKGHTRGE